MGQPWAEKMAAVALLLGEPRLEELLGDATVLMMGWGNPDLLGNLDDDSWDAGE